MPDDAINRLGESRLRDGLCMGRLVGWTGAGEPRVELDRYGLGPWTARIATQVSTNELVTATGAELLLAVCDGEIVVMAILRERGLEELVNARADAGSSADRERIELHARDEIVLRCGEASLVMRRNGRVVLTGSYVETHSTGINRIKGGTVQIN